MTEWASPLARAARTKVFGTFAGEGRPPSPAELADDLGAASGAIEAALAELHEAHAVVLTRAGDGIRMAHPFSAWPMGFVVRAGDRLWWGGCAWDSFGIVAALGERLAIATTCPGCGAELRYAASPAEPPDLAGAVVRIPRPAAEWWDDVVATCTAIRAFCSAGHLEDWLGRTGDPTGVALELERLWDLALPWYRDRLDPGWSPRPRQDAQRIRTDTDVTGPFWTLP
jgi:Alkylmercury lyase